MCIGAPFALQLMKIAVAAIVRRFRISIMPGTRVNRNASLTLGPKGSIPVLIKRQDGRFSASPVYGQIHEMVKLPMADRRAVAA